MSKPLKKGWTRVAFGDVVRLYRERSGNPDRDGFERYVGLEHIEPGDLTIRRWGDVADGTSFTNVFRAGQVLFGKRRAYQRKIAVADFDGVCSGDIYVFEAKDEHLLPELLPFICQADGFFEHAVGTSAGSLSPRTNWESLASYEFALPPLEKQRQMARTLTASVAYGEALVRLIDRHGRVRRGAINGLTESSHWPKRTIDNLCSMQNGKAFPGTSYANSGIRLLRPGNLGQSGYLTWAPPKTAYLSKKWEQQAPEFVVRPGDVVINLTAQSLEDGFMGRVCLAREGDRSLLNQRLGRFRDWRTDVLPEYVFRVFQSHRFQQHAIKMCEGSKVKHIFWTYISRFEMGLPSLKEQRAIVNILRQVDALLAQIIERSRAHGRLNRQLIAKVFERDGTASSGDNMGDSRQ